MAFAPPSIVVFAIPARFFVANRMERLMTKLCAERRPASAPSAPGVIDFVGDFLKEIVQRPTRFFERIVQHRSVEVSIVRCPFLSKLIDNPALFCPTAYFGDIWGLKLE